MGTGNGDRAGAMRDRKTENRKIKYFPYGMPEGTKCIRFVKGMKRSGVFMDPRLCYLLFLCLVSYVLHEVISVKY